VGSANATQTQCSTPPVEAELAVQSTESFLEALQKPSTPSSGKSISLVLNVRGGSSFAPQYTAVMVRHGALVRTDSVIATPISTKTPATLGKDHADDRHLSLDGLHAEWQVMPVAPSDDSDVQLSASAGKFSETKNYTLAFYVDCSDTKLCVADGDIVTTVLTIGSASSSKGDEGG
jgi:hypothetical protein